MPCVLSVLYPGTVPVTSMNLFWEAGVPQWALGSGQGSWGPGRSPSGLQAFKDGRGRFSSPSAVWESVC